MVDLVDQTRYFVALRVQITGIHCPELPTTS